MSEDNFIRITREPDVREKFTALAGKGFQITFANGWTVSVIFGLYNYCDNYDNHRLRDKDASREDLTGEDLTCPNAEVAVFKRERSGLYKHPDFGDDTVGTYYTPKMVLDLMTWAEALDPDFDYDPEASEDKESE